MGFSSFPFQDLCKYLRGELKPDLELATIQAIVAQGIEREELRDEIFVQCMRQTTNCPQPEWADRIWLLLCLCVVAFQPSKLLFKVGWFLGSILIEGVFFFF